MAKVFKDLVFCFSGTLSQSRADISKLVKKHGATVSTSVTKKTTHLITTESSIDPPTSSVDKARENEIHIVGEDFITDCIEEGKLLPEKDYSLDKDGDDDDDDKKKKKAPTKKASTSSSSSKKRKIDQVDDDEEEEDDDEEPAPKKSQTNIKKIVARGKYPVEPESGYANNGKIHVEGNEAYSIMLGQANIKGNNNKFYSLQLIDVGGKYIVHTRWGRIGANGQKKQTSHSDIKKAKADFAKKFKEKTKNEWADRANFVKHSGKYTMVENSYEESDEEEEEATEVNTQKTTKATPNSKLDTRVQDVIKLISNTDTMNETLKEYEIDIKKMPLGKLSKNQITKGYSVLKKIQRALDGTGEEEEDDDDELDLDDLSSEFYSLIPHNFGRNRPKVIDSIAKLKINMELLETLGDLEVASKLLKGADHDVNPIDAAYASLKTNIQPLDKNGEEFKIVTDFVKNTHGSTHQLRLEVLDAFAVEREGEKERFGKYKDLHNKKLLWHGSRMTNYMGILSQGLRIAPPEAPVTGYMFGKGVYFADMVTKSANYCFARATNNIGFMLLSEVALGDMYERTAAEYVQNLPNAKHQATYGRGKTMPDPKQSIMMGDVEVPLGTPVDAGIRTDLLYNEFIVYDVAQVNIKYMLKIKFN